MGERINAGILALHVNGNTYRITEVRHAGGRTVAVGRELRPDGSEGPGRILAVDKLTPIDTDPADSVDLTIPTERFSDPTDTDPTPTGPSILDTPTDDTPPDPAGPADHHAHTYSPITLAAIRSLRGAILDSLSSLRPDETGKRAVLHTSLDEVSALMNRAGTAPEWDGAGAVPGAPGPLGSRDRQGEPKTRRRRRRIDRKSHAMPRSLFRTRTHGTTRNRLDRVSSPSHPAPFAAN